jgi:hypothetical protein
MSSSRERRRRACATAVACLLACGEIPVRVCPVFYNLVEVTKTHTFSHSHTHIHPCVSRLPPVSFYRHMYSSSNRRRTYTRLDRMCVACKCGEN